LSSSPAVTELADGKLRLDRPAEHVARLTIDNPAKRNALDHPILDAIAATLPGLEDDVRCLLLTAVGPVFSAGYDIGMGPGAPDFPDRAEALVAHPFTSAIEAIEAFPYPTVAALNGHAIGGGLELALSCDLRLAAEQIKVGMPPAKLGLIYSHTGLRRFVDAIGAPRTRELFLRGRNVEVERALGWGLVNEVVPAEALGTVAVAYAAEVAGRAGADRPARVVLRVRGLPRGRAGVRGEAGAQVARSLTGCPHAAPTGSTPRSTPSPTTGLSRRAGRASTTPG